MDISYSAAQPENSAGDTFLFSYTVCYITIENVVFKSKFEKGFLRISHDNDRLFALPLICKIS
jgi:hypothetical protein